MSDVLGLYTPGLVDSRKLPDVSVYTKCANYHLFPDVESPYCA